MLENMNQLERRVFRSYWDDGLLDLFAAVGVTLIGLCWLRNLPVGAVFVPAMLAPFWAPVRRKLIEPRLGLVEFTEAREKRNRRALQLTLYSGIALLVLAIELYFFRDALFMTPSTAFVAGLPAILLAGMGIIASILVGSARFLIYGAILIGAAATGIAHEWQPGSILAVAGAAMLSISVGLLTRFIRANPVEPEVN